MSKVSPIKVRRWDLLAVSLLTVAASVTSLTQPLSYSPLRSILGFLFVFTAPGYALSKLLYEEKELSLPERFVLSVGLSISLAVLISLSLNYTPVGIRLRPLVLITSALTLTLVLLSVLRELPLKGRPS